MPKKITYPTTVVDSIIYSLINNNGEVSAQVKRAVDFQELTEIIIPSTVDFPNYPSVPVTSIAASAFASCSLPSFISIPSSVKKIGRKAFAVLYLEPKKPKEPKEEEKFGNPKNPRPIELKIPAEFASSAYFNMLRVLAVTIISGDKIPDQAFRGAIKLETVIFENDSSSSLISIGDAAFKDCISLKEIILPDTVTNIGANTFSGCKDLLSIVIPSGVSNIKIGTFYKCSSLKNIFFQHKSLIEYIGGNAFAYCRELNSLTIPNSVNIINAQAFYNCRNLSNILIPSNVKKIGNQSFFACTNLKEVTFEQKEYLPTIGNKAFENNARDNTANYYISVQTVNPESLLRNVGFSNSSTIKHK